MKVQADITPKMTVSVGDILRFNHSGSAGDGSFYLVCRDEEKGYFIMNLGGKKKRITYYDTLGYLLRTHEAKILEVYPASEYQIKLERL